MTRLPLALLCFALGALTTLAVPSATATPPPPISTTIVVSDQADLDYLEDHAEVSARIHYLAKLKLNHEANANAADAAALAVGVRIRRALVRRKPGLDATLPATISDFVVAQIDDAEPFGEFTAADSTAMLINADAAGQ